MNNILLFMLGVTISLTPITHAIGETVTFKAGSKLVFSDHTKASGAGELGVGWKQADFAKPNGETIPMFPTEKLRKNGGVVFSGPDDVQISPSGRFAVFFVDRIGVLSPANNAPQISVESRQYCPVLDTQSGCIKSNLTGQMCGGEWDSKEDLWKVDSQADTPGDTQAMLHGASINAADIWSKYVHAKSSNSKLKLASLIADSQGIQNVMACDPPSADNEDYYIKIKSQLIIEKDHASLDYINTCANVNGEQDFPPLSINGGTVCFVREPVLDPKSGAPVGADSIALYYVASGWSNPVKAEGRGLLYDDTPGKIVDAFSLNVGHGEKIVVIHYMDVRNSLAEQNSSGKFYSVDVFESIGGALRRDERISDWFGSGYSFISDGSRLLYKFPYLSRKDVLLAVDSPFAILMTEDADIYVRLKFRSYLFDLPNIIDKTRKYLIKGDQATVNKASAGWCRVIYSGGVRPLEMWLMCSALDVDSRPKKAN
ncbi:hypothetical protein [Cupriavidus sp. BIS7]|uniref:hypothetical protein n=1 Tax=Cupriavidus sp. BIS7 TaxID=1217718 RepID=UPI0002D73421|nr:hypothetical protein [Cupriavidus sp. BIS7]